MIRRLMRRSFIAAAVLALGLAAGCATAMPEPAELEPIAAGPGGSAAIAFKRLVFRIPSGSGVGAHHVGPARIPRFKYNWQSNIAAAPDEFKIIASELLSSQGYSVLGGRDLLFGEDESAKAEYQLGGVADKIQYNTYGRGAGDFSGAYMNVEWSLYDSLKRKVVHSAATEGRGRQSNIGSACLQAAFRQALSNLMADPGFAEILKQSPEKEWRAGLRFQEPLVIPCGPAPATLRLPKDLDAAMQSVVVIKSGASMGGGVLISPGGWALTAAHVVSGVDEVSVTLKSGLTMQASVVRSDPVQDVALIKLPGQGRRFSRVCMENAPEVGSDVYAIGAPSGEALSYSVSRGIVSGLREWDGRKYIQTDAALNSGNSGGPLFSAGGEVLEVVNWKIAAAGFEGLAFGVPVNAIAQRLNVVLK